MITPLFKRALAEGAGAAGGIVFAVTITTEEVALIFSVAVAAVGVIVWLVRLEGRINTLTAVVERVDDRTEKIADRMGAL